MTLPKIINPCPIVEAIVEIRFDTVIVADAVFGLIYNAFKDSYPKIEKLGILQIPEAIRLKDPELMDKPHYKLSNDNFIFQIGPNAVSIISPMDYIGWEKFFDEILRSFKIIDELQIINKIKRVGLRYINFFDFDIFEKINLNIKFHDSPLQSNQTSLRSEIPAGNFINTLQIVNRAEISMKNERKHGSIIDIDTVLNGEYDNFFKDIKTILEDGHIKEKELFFGLLKPDLLESLNPKY